MPITCKRGGAASRAEPPWAAIGRLGPIRAEAPRLPICPGHWQREEEREDGGDGLEEGEEGARQLRPPAHTRRRAQILPSSQILTSAVRQLIVLRSADDVGDAGSETLALSRSDISFWISSRMLSRWSQE